uniref:C2H2-type domain-containing protein n=1 Tax=Nothobranchius korthausae TaxID=1143690 RepID=A0A1A8GUK5_9TELE
MPSADRQNYLVMEKQTTVTSFASAQLIGESSTFICTECGDGFSQYSSVLSHMAVHGPLDSFSFDGSSYGFEIPREYVLQENGTLTVLNGLSQSHSSNSSTSVKPISSGVLPSHLPVSPNFKPQPSSYKDPLRQRPSDLDKSQQGHHRCEICNRSFNGLQNLHRHQQYRNTERGYKCTLCCRIVEDRHGLKKHIQSHLSEQINYCGHCGKRFLAMDALNAHQKENHSLPKPLGKPENKEDKKSEKAYACKKCKLNFFWVSDLQIHSLYYCKGQEPDVGFLSEIEGNSNDSEDMQLVNCHSNGTVDEIKNGDSHISREASSETEFKPTFTPYRCGLCGDTFEKLSSLKEHHVTHQTQEEIDKLNQESQKTFKRRIPPKGKRRRSNQNGKLHPCKHCHRVFNHSSSLSRHMRYHKGTMHTCAICGRQFPQRCDLRRHLVMYHKTELEKKPGLKLLYLRPKNGNAPKFDDAENINSPGENTNAPSENELVSTDQNPTEKQTRKAGRINYKCQECGKKFGLLCVYQRHLRYHKKETNKCPQCPAQFKNPSSLELHLQNHPNIEHTVDGTGQTSHDIETNEDKAHEKDKADDREDYPGEKQKNKENSSEALYECTECTKAFSCLDTFLQHQTSHGSETLTNEN